METLQTLLEHFPPNMKRRRFSTAFGVVVRRRRYELDLSQEALAERAALSPVYVGFIERNVRSPTIDTAEKIANALGITLAKLIEEAESEWRRSFEERSRSGAGNRSGS